ncbi:forkhead box protein N4 [Ixodes scapularis]|uniref:forkhead box protein N4 n=1 Tax=Ixodes scapularis TaxID=6945 RepID=UPI001C38693D|nr:forkhead box protein N4 [Ixodes scapularis]XP_042145296.1 forkhead box protein N4 [Ixodes scapularis]
MELYEDAFRLQEMIESDMRAEVEQLLAPGSGGELRCAADAGESLDAFDSPLGPSVWLGSHGISLISDLDGLEGLLVDPQTGLPSHRSSMPQTTLVNVTLAAAVTEPEPAPLPQRAASRTSQDRSYPKPAYSYSCLIAMALRNSRTGSLPVNEIYSFMTENFPYFRTAPSGWKNSVRHNLSLNKCFEKIEKPGTGAQRKGCLWTLSPARAGKMHDELLKWSKKDPAAIRRSMANPERLELLERGQLALAAPALPHRASEEDDEEEDEDPLG